MITTRTKFSTRPTKTGLSLSLPEKQAKIKVTHQDDGLTLQGDGFHHSISVSGDKVEIKALNESKAASTFEKPRYLEGTKRVAAGVAAVMTGLPVIAFTGAEPGKVYLNMGYRSGMGLRKDRSRMGGRYRITGMDQKLHDSFTIHGTKAWGGQVMTLGSSRHERAAVTDFTTRSGRPLLPTDAFKQMTGTHFAEQIQSGLVALWREAGEPESVDKATKIAAKVFDKLYRFDENYAVFHTDEKAEEILWNLENLPPRTSWDVLSTAVSQGDKAETLARKLKEQFD